MSCNPSIGGIGKGHLVREVDALGGIMGLAADEAGIQFRVLNASKGPAVQGPRAQIDRDLYRNAVSAMLAGLPNLHIKEASVDSLMIRDAPIGETFKYVIDGVELSNGDIIRASKVIITTGTFLGGMLHIGDKRLPSGRLGDQASTKLAHMLKHIGFPISRLKTGTPPRLDGSTINYKGLEVQHGDNPPIPFSFINDSVKWVNSQVPCYLTRTTLESHSIIQENMSKYHCMVN